MSISNRFRDIAKDVAGYYTDLCGHGEAVERGRREVNKANLELAEWVEQVGEIPEPAVFK